ncbi:MAG: NAD(P)-binding domain-containing protein, partial [Planctomycetaceae bacterium]|nr:NAD(P)-binding domain-containing protein [Planctomycetaceae bacterium]
MNRLQVAIIGAGPIGLEAALQASEAGFAVSLFEKKGIAQNLRDWGHIKLFTPFGMNASAVGIEMLQQAGYELPSRETLLTGREFADVYLLRLADLLRDRIEVCEDTNIIAVSRGDLLKGEAIGNRSEHHKFRLLLEHEQTERIVWADYVLDCSGVYPHHNWLGTGGIACPGERSLSSKINYELPDLTGPAADRYREISTLVVGSGYSAATTICELAEIAKNYPGTEVHWVTRNAHQQGPIGRFNGDSLAGRDELAQRANQLAVDQTSPIHWHCGVVVEHLQPHAGSENIVVTLRSLNQPATESGQIEVSEIIAQIGYRPDRTVHEELQIHECYATSGPIKLAAFLLGQQ